jgi:hypothetical protein
MIDRVNGLAFLDDVPAQQTKADDNARAVIRLGYPPMLETGAIIRYPAHRTLPLQQRRLPGLFFPGLMMRA